MSPRILYVERRFSPGSLRVIAQANTIIDEYAAQGFNLTLRQLYYQFVSRGIIPNRDSEYKRLGSIVNDARLAGLIDWEAIEDMTRNLRSNAHWAGPDEIVEAAANQYLRDLWADQPYRPEVWIEKDALVGVIAGVCQELDIAYFSCRGYASQSELWRAAQRLQGHLERGQEPVILHLGDHDPSGIDMTRDIMDRLQLFMGGVDVDRLALNRDQVALYNPPPNPAKTTDSRFVGYIRIHGTESWELDALEPQVIADLIRQAAEDIRDETLWTAAVEHSESERDRLRMIADRWSEIQEYLALSDGEESGDV